MKILFLFLITIVIIQWYFKMKQVKILHEHYNRLLSKGNVIVETKKGAFSGVIIMIQLDDKAYIKECLLLSGATFFSKWKVCEDIINKNLTVLSEKDLLNYKTV